MTRPRHFWECPRELRNYNLRAIELAEAVHQREKMLIHLLYEMDERRIYVRFGYNSLRGYCEGNLKFSKTQSQRLVLQVRSYKPLKEPLIVEFETASEIEIESQNKEMIKATRRLLQRPR